MKEIELIFNKPSGCEVSDLGDDCLMVYDSENAISHILNPVASFLWQNCDGKKTVIEIIRSLESFFDMENMSETEVQNDCVNAILDMYKKKILIKSE